MNMQERARIVPNDLSTAANTLRIRLAASKRALGELGFEWYPYDSLSNVPHVLRLLGTEYESVLESAIAGGVLDVGCGDGDMSFLFESMGCPSVTAIDSTVTNHNGMRGLWALKRNLGSAVEVLNLDIDAQFTLPPRRYGLTFLLGALYHLKNPFYVMEVLAKASEYCIVSTRIARELPDGTRIPTNMPLAYLLDADELNNDDSNYWIFSDAGLKRLLLRTKWEVCDYFSAGDIHHSDPVSLAHDERAFCLLRSHYGLSHLELGAGWYEPEQTGWRWTKRRFSVAFSSDFVRYRRLTMRVFIPDLLLERLGSITLSGTADGAEIEPALFRTPGEHIVERRVRFRPDLSSAHVLLFELDKCLDGYADRRELGIIVASVEFD